MWLRRALIVAVGLGCLGSLVGAATAGANTPSAESVGRLGSSGGALDYSKDAGGRLRPLTPDFIAQSLGLSFASPSLGAVPAKAAGDGLGSDRASGRVVNPVTSPVYHCVNGHQTEDPLSPPCVPQFSGDNGGATYRGVSGSEVRILVTLGLSDISLRHPSFNHYYDLGVAPGADETQNMPWMQRLRVLQEYFNQRFQTYGRRVHLWARASPAAPGRAAINEARLDDITVRPFAVIVIAPYGGIGPEYTEELNRRGVASFNMLADPFDDATYLAARGLAWSFMPAAQEAADLYGSYLCQKVVHGPAVASGNPGENGRPRRLGLLQVSDAREGRVFGPFIELVRRRVEACGGRFVDTEHYQEPNGCDTQVEDESGGGTGTADTQAMAGFRAHRVTTIIWPACLGLRMPRSALALGYQPEWILWGAGGLDENIFGFGAAWPGGVWDGHAVIVTPSIFRPDIPQRLCYRAMTSIDGSTPRDDVTDAACDYYDGLRQLFTSLQLAGPRLTPAAIDEGVRILRTTSSDPQTPRCEYPAADYSCVKDAQVEWWDSTGPGDPTPPFLGHRSGGCWRAMEGGHRYAAAEWPGGDIVAQRRPDDPCNLHGAHAIPTPMS